MKGQREDTGVKRNLVNPISTTRTRPGGFRLRGPHGYASLRGTTQKDFTYGPGGGFSKKEP